MKSIFAFGALLALGACSRGGSQPTGPAPAEPITVASAPPATTDQPPPAANPPAAPAASETPDDCEHLFSPPPGAVKLCDQHDLATNAEVHWESYATKESRVDVNHRYHVRGGKCGAGIVTKPPIFSVTQGPTRLSTHEASTKDFPTCDKKLAPDHQTVIVISTKFDR